MTSCSIYESKARSVLMMDRADWPSFLQAVQTSKFLLQGAISKSHASHTAKWLTETAAACIDMGLQASVSGLQMSPVSYHHLSIRMQGMFPDTNQLLIKLQSPSGQKYFTLLGPLERPYAVILDLSSIIHTPGRDADVDRLLSSIQVITEHCNFSNDDSKPPGYSTIAPSRDDATDSLAVSNMAVTNVSTIAFGRS